MKKTYRHTIFRQLVIFSILISVMPAILISTMLFIKIKDRAKADLSVSHSQIVSQYTENLTDKLNHYQEGVHFIANNTSLIEELSDSDGNTYLRGRYISEEVSKSLFQKEANEIRKCMVYALDEENPVYGASASMLSIARKEPWYQEELLMKEGWFTYDWPNGNTQILSFIQPVYQHGNLTQERLHIGSVKLDIVLNRLMEPSTNRNYHIFVYNEKRKLLYASDPTHFDQIWDSIKGQTSERLEQDGAFLGEYRMEYEKIHDYGMNVLFLFENRELQQRSEEALLLIIPVLLVILLVVLSASYLYTRHFSSRIERLVKKFKTAETGDLTLYDAIEGDDEIAQLDYGFNHMISKLNILIKKNYVEKLEKKEMQLRNLQLQINPHFLYNTLETISSLAAIQNMFDVCEMSQKLGEIFRYSLGRNHGEFVTVEQELNHTQNYIFIQKMRYGNRFEVFYNIEVDTGRQILPRFILQPIVENAIVHGWGELTVNGTLEISVYRQGQDMYIKIEDDGQGMEKEKVDELNFHINNQKDINETKKSIGIQNVNQRIKFSCGEEYGITIASEPGNGSRFLIKLPFLSQGGVKDEV